MNETIEIQKERKSLLSAKTPEAYIKKSLKTNLSKGMRSKITKEWLTKTGFSMEDLETARHEHPQWKTSRNINSRERQLKRMEQYNFKGQEKNRIQWTKEKLLEFLTINKKLSDREMAEHFETTLPAINHIRRKIKITHRIFEAMKKKPTTKQMIPYLKKGERNLKTELDAVSK